METGFVKWYSRKKGYGFIEYDDKDIFVHSSEIKNMGKPVLYKGDNVNFNIIKTDKGEKAIDVVLIKIINRDNNHGND